MVHLLRRVYSFYAAFVFLVSFLLLFPLFWIFLQNKKTYFLGHHVNRLWGVIVYTLCFIRFSIEFKKKFDRSTSHVYCANHTSYVDIPTLYLAIPGVFSFIGKISLGKVPLFGYMYSRLHILVDRKDPNSRMDSLRRSGEVLDAGGSIAIFPEGTIPRHPPRLLDFKDGAFRLAIEKQIPLVPVTIPNNWLILPDDGSYLPFPKVCKVIFHEPISTIGMDASHVRELKERTFQIIEQELKQRLGDAYR